MNSPRLLFFPRDIFRFLYWVFFKPFTLEAYIENIAPQIKDRAIFTLYKQKETNSALYSLATLASTSIFAFSCILTISIAIILFFMNWKIDLIGLIFGMLLGIISGLVIGLFLDMRFGIFTSILLALSSGIGYGVTDGVTINFMGGLTSIGKFAFSALQHEFGIVGVWSLIIIFNISLGLIAESFVFYRYHTSNTKNIGFMVVAIMAISFPISAYMNSFAVNSIGLGFASGIGALIGYFRLFIYLLEVPINWFLVRILKGYFKFSPIYWDEMIWPPLPDLDELLIKIAQQDRQQGMEAIAAVAGSFRQSWAAKRALLELTAADMEAANSLLGMSSIASTLGWLPDTARMDMQELLLGLEQASQHARAALESETLYNKQEQLRLGLQVVERVRSGLALAENSALARRMIPALEGWRDVFRREEAAASGLEQIPNVYHSGTPLIKESKTFKGRRDLFRMLGNELVNPSGQRPALLLFGARRMGKSSTLKQLPIQLGPQIIPATVDVQSAGAAEDAAGLLYLIAREIIRSARLERHLQLPELTRDMLQKDPYLAFQEWLEPVEKKLGDYYWVLLALDEFESLGDMVAEGRADERIFQTLRGLMQHHPRITVLMSGAHTLEELPPLWSNYLINTKMLKVGPLSEDEARELVLHPIPDFPLTYDEDAVALLLSETGCHPNWLQFTCREIVEKLNNENRFHATRVEVASALARVPEVLAGDFKDLWEGRDSSDLLRKLLKTVAANPTPLPAVELQKWTDPHLPETIDSLLRRDILIAENDTYRFRANLLRRWVVGK